jgi:F0F1-type ATP synthase epsilon subunit
MQLELTIITPERRLHLPALRQVCFQTPQGETGLLPGHASLITLAECGLVRAFPAGPDPNAPPQSLVTSSGIMRAHGDRLTLLIQHLETEEEIDAEAARTQLQEATAMFATLDPVLDAEDYTYWTRTADFNRAILALAGEMPSYSQT